MKVRAKISFCGKISMKVNEEKEINNKEILKDLLNAGYVVAAEESETEAEIVKKPKRNVKNEDQ